MRRANDVAAQGVVPGAVYDGDGTHLVGDGPALTPELAEALIQDKPGRRAAVLETGDRLF